MLRRGVLLGLESKRGRDWIVIVIFCYIFGIFDVLGPSAALISSLSFNFMIFLMSMKFFF